MAYIELRGLEKGYEQQKVVRDVSLQVEKGQFVVLAGPSGCGKTTTLRLLAGLLSPDQGQIVIEGRDMTKVPVEGRQVVMVFQEALLFPHLNVAQNVGFGLKMQGQKTAAIEEKVKRMLGFVQLAGMEKRYPNELSGGQRQRVALARALALEPKVLLLDEPLSNLDPTLRSEMRELILGLHHDLKMTTICVTHDSEEALYLADRIAVMFDGQIIQYATPQEVYLKPVDGRVAEFFGRCNMLSCELKEGYLFWQGVPQFPIKGGDGQVLAYVRPEQIRVLGGWEKGALTGTLRRKVFSGDKNIYYLDVGEQTILVYSKSVLKDQAGIRVSFKINWPEVHLSEVKDEDFYCHSCA